MSCMCGDTNCPSCGPAQGYDPATETVCDWVLSVLLDGFPDGFDLDWLSGEITDRIGRRAPQEVADAIYAAAKKWEREIGQ